MEGGSTIYDRRTKPLLHTRKKYLSFDFVFILCTCTQTCVCVCVVCVCVCLCVCVYVVCVCMCICVSVWCVFVCTNTEQTDLEILVKRISFLVFPEDKIQEKKKGKFLLNWNFCKPNASYASGLWSVQFTLLRTLYRCPPPTFQ